MPGRSIQDANSAVKVSVALPNAANTVNTNVIDLGNNAPYPITESILVKLAITTATGANSKNINVYVQHSNESNANFVNVAELATWVNAGNATNYTAATSTVALPPATRRYIIAKATGEANGGNASDGTLSAQLLF